jgi:hypothetical protein
VIGSFSPLSGPPSGATSVDPPRQMPERELTGVAWGSTFRDERICDERHYVFELSGRELAGSSGKEIPSRVRR